jgi:hypothetical protein
MAEGDWLDRNGHHGGRSHRDAGHLVLRGLSMIA